MRAWIQEYGTCVKIDVDAGRERWIRLRRHDDDFE